MALAFALSNHDNLYLFRCCHNPLVCLPKFVVEIWNQDKSMLHLEDT